MSELDQMYQEVILDHSKRRIGEGLAAEIRERPGKDAVTEPVGQESAAGADHEYNPTCGDEIRLRVGLRGETVESVTWEGDGCSISMAAASVLSEMAPGSSLEQLREQLDAFREMLHSRGRIEPDVELLGDAAAFAGVSRFVARVKCAALGWVAAEKAIERAQAGQQG
ncbi:MULTISPECIES: Fe-S cluster assembly sulfur transfer protein SufU [Kocuria]|uniref:Fe-S cluster assembly sulfur transfer protein SufU n=1 Tax=Kocuria TaxID=57493 RepID=UPI0006AA3DEA|nr:MULTISPECIES: SUF system NifU family Fe-S cluster assembly protein [Kocuria]MDN5703361.1 SUF system NifU family Fe-S cluster assembly protein [Micrococcales bacterium]ALB03621.1 nitrogen fixation protein NifU [Kocuria palustris]MCM3331289.1 SUF system NifU family Fe-S cluster assembly protein [Kocuria palustris]MCT1589879.1 SUF system NifU family Fe-S cluster assembly protein [Kocuria palustris]MCT1834626.1 SUF system NifU family Fe-S cluster assembly protein [Kocuria palustris]